MSFCHSCGTPTQPSWNNCTKCGAKIQTIDNRNPANFSDLELMQSGWSIEQIYELRNPPLETPIPQNQVWYPSENNSPNTCSNCGKELFKGFRKCSHCGTEQLDQNHKKYDWDSPESIEVSGQYHFAKKYHNHLTNVRNNSVKLIDYTSFIFTMIIFLFPIVFVITMTLSPSFDEIPEWMQITMVILFILFIFSASLEGLIFGILGIFGGKTDDPPRHRYQVMIGYNRKKVYNCTYCNYSINQTFWNNGKRLMKKHWKVENHFGDYYNAVISGVINESKHQKRMRYMLTMERYAYILFLIFIVILIFLFIT